MAVEPPDDDLLQAIRRVEEIQRRADGVPFTPAAYTTFKRRIAEYVSALVDESVRVARQRHSPDIVSNSDVESASERLGVRPRSHRRQIIGTLGSLALGAAVGNALQIVGAVQVAPESAIFTFVFGTAGAAMMVFGYGQD